MNNSYRWAARVVAVLMASFAALAGPIDNSGAAAYEATQSVAQNLYPNALVVSKYGHKPTAKQLKAAQYTSSNARGSSGNNGVIQFTAGCRRFTVNNYEKTPLGYFAAEFSTYTDYCYHPKAKKAGRLTKIRHGYYTRSADFFNWRGITRNVQRKTNACHHKNFMQARWTNDVPGPWPHFNTFLTTNMIVVSCVGTMHWATDDLARP